MNYYHRLFILFIFCFSFLFPSYTFASTLIYDNAGGDKDWANVNNWQGGVLPTTNDDVVITADVYQISTGTASVNSATFSNNIPLGRVYWGENLINIITLTVATTATFNPYSYNYGTIIGDVVGNSFDNVGTITGNVVFNKNTYNEGTITGNAVFNDTSGNGDGTVTGNAVFNDTSDNGDGTVTGNAVFNYLSSNIDGTVMGNATFACTATNEGTVGGTTTVLPCDITPPIISSITSTPSTTSALISWNVSETANSIVSYGLSTSYGNITATTSASTISLSSLSTCSTYNFSITSSDPSHNIATSSNQSLITTGCPTPTTTTTSSRRSSGGRRRINTSTLSSTSTPPEPIVWLFTRDLTLGFTGEDVKLLQKFLNSKGFPVSYVGVGSFGQETTYFGNLTKAALARFQAAKGITPSVGYFGSITRKYIQTTTTI